jgi:hypothetical protein
MFLASAPTSRTATSWNREYANWHAENAELGVPCYPEYSEVAPMRREVRFLLVIEVVIKVVLLAIPQGAIARPSLSA